VPGLFARNERLVCVFEAPHGAMVLTLVGATIVGSMATVWHGVVNRSRQKTVREWHYADATSPVVLKKGDEMGRFLLGSTVVLLFPAGSLQFNPDWQAGGPVQLGQAMATASEQVSA
jgi:phosphatidylserine decarboxylase